MPQLKNIVTGALFETSENPIWVDGTWECGDLRFMDPAKTVYEIVTGSTVIPLIGPIAFQMLFTVEELVAIDAAKEANAGIRIFWKLLDDPRTDFVDRNLEPIKTMLHSLEQAGLIGPGRADEILTGQVSK